MTAFCSEAHAAVCRQRAAEAAAREPLARFDGAAVWATLTDLQRDEIGSIALETVASGYVDERLYQDGDCLDPRVLRVARANEACWPAFDDLKAAFVDAIPREFLEAPDGSPLIPSTVGPVCRGCGCAEDDACHAEDIPCGWAEEDLCTACAEGRAP